MIRVTDRRLTAVVIACVLALAAPAAVLGHAELKTATPAAGSVQTKPVTQVAGVYTDSMKKDGSSIELLDASGASVAKGGLDPADDTRLVVSLDAPLVAGRIHREVDIGRKRWRPASRRVGVHRRCGSVGESVSGTPERGAVVDTHPERSPDPQRPSPLRRPLLRRPATCRPHRGVAMSCCRSSSPWSCSVAAPPTY